MNGQIQKGGWFLPAADDTAIQNDVKKKYGWFTWILYNVLLLWIGGYLLIQMIDNIRMYGINLSGIIKIVICTVMVLAGFFGLIDIIKNAVSFKKSVFYVKTCRIVGMRGETPRKRTTWYVTVLDGDQETEYCCRNNPFYSDEEIAAKREITIATFDDVNDEDEISMVYILDQVYPNYRNPA